VILNLFRLDTFHRVVLISKETIAHAIPIGRSELIFEGPGFGPYCGLAALSGEAIVSTEGLKWNLSTQLMRMGSMTSSSNELISLPTILEEKEYQDGLGTREQENNCPVIIETSNPIFWTCSIDIDQLIKSMRDSISY
jgi:hypothetical protein